MHRQIDSPQSGQHPVTQGLQVPNHQSFFASLLLGAQIVKNHVTAHHQRGNALLAGIPGAQHIHHFAAAHHAHPVADLHHFRQPVGDHDHRHVLFLDDAPDHREQFIGFLRRQNRGGFVQNQHLRARAQGLQNLHPLLQANAQIPHHIRRVHFQPVGFRQLPYHLIGLLLIVEGAPLLGFMPQQDVLRHRKAGHQLEMLMHHAHPHAHGLIWAVHRSRGQSADVDLAQRGLMQTIQQIHQRGFARAVFAHQREHFALVDAQADVVVGQRAGKLHAHMGEPDNFFQGV